MLPQAQDVREGIMARASVRGTRPTFGFALDPRPAGAPGRYGSRHPAGVTLRALGLNLGDDARVDLEQLRFDQPREQVNPDRLFGKDFLKERQ